MSTTNNTIANRSDERHLKAMSGMACLIMNILATLAGTAAFVVGIVLIERSGASPLTLALVIIGALYAFALGLDFSFHAPHPMIPCSESCE